MASPPPPDSHTDDDHSSASAPPTSSALLSSPQPRSEASPSSWVILGSIPRVSADLPEGADLDLALTAPPRVSRLTVSTRVFPKTPTEHHFPFLLAADPSGLLLLSAILPSAPRRVVVDRGPDDYSFHWSFTDPRYFVLDAASGTALRLPDPADEPVMHQALLGILASPAGGGHYMVAELRPIIGSDHATLLCFSSDLGEWVEKDVRYTLPPRPLAPICVLSHHGRLWWVDLSWGIITADPFADNPVLGFVPFPEGRVLQCREGWGVTDKFRYVGLSDGKLRFVDTIMRRRLGGIPKVTVWTLDDPDSTEWTLEHEARFADIWAHPSYKATGLPKKRPVLALIHPTNPAVVYFFLGDHLFGVDVPACKVVDCERYQLVAPPTELIANRFIRAWDMPRAVSSGLANWMNGMSLSETATVPASSSRPSAEGGTNVWPPGAYHLVGNTRQTFIG
ncbi:hypothetical protein ACP70R_030803 [Stipagrostis hirtigluma subsp. patula]